MKAFLFLSFVISLVEFGYAATSAPTASPTFSRQYNYIFKTAGLSTSATVPSGTGGKATAASFVGPKGMYVDTTGKFYVADETGYCLRYFNSVGDQVVYNFAGVCAATGGSSGLGGKATSALLDQPLGITGDATGNVYFADFNNNLVKKVSLSGFITAYAGDGTTNAPVYGAAATSSALNGIGDCWLNSLGEMYLAPTTFNQVSKISASGIVSLVAGIYQAASNAGDGGAATSAKLASCPRLTGTSTGMIYVVDSSSYRVRLISASGIISTAVGTGSTTYLGENIAGTSMNIGTPLGVGADPLTGNMYYADYQFDRVGVLTQSSGLVSTHAGTGVTGYSGDGGAATSAMIAGPRYLTTDTTGKLFIADYLNKIVRAVYSLAPTSSPTMIPTISPTVLPTVVPTLMPSVVPSVAPTVVPTMMPTVVPTLTPTVIPTIVPTVAPSGAPTVSPSMAPTAIPSVSPSSAPSLVPTVVPSVSPTVVPTIQPSAAPTTLPTVSPTLLPTITPTCLPSVQPTVCPSVDPTVQPSAVPTIFPTLSPTTTPSVQPTVCPSVSPTIQPSVVPTTLPTLAPSMNPTIMPTCMPSVLPSVKPSVLPSTKPSVRPTVHPSVAPTVSPTLKYLPIMDSPSYKVVNTLAFAGISSSGGVMCWGAAESGGDCSDVEFSESDSPSDSPDAGTSTSESVVEVVSSKNAFAALTSSGRVVAWGSSSEIAGWEAATSGVTVVSLTGAERAFAGVTASGGVIAFGADCCGGNVDQYGAWSALYLCSGVDSVRANTASFCALKTDGSVFCWGNVFTGGGVSTLTRSDLTDIASLSSTRSAFAGLTSDGSVVTWGHKNARGGLSAEMIALLEGKTEYIVSSGQNFVAYTTAHNLISWGVNTNVVSSNSTVIHLAHSSSAFAALRSNRSVLVWGDDANGGDASSVAGELTNVTSVVGNTVGFAAVTGDGRVVSWGGVNVSVSAAAALTDVVSVSCTSRAFAALKSDGSVVTWGTSNLGGSVNTNVASYLTSGVRLLCANEVAFTAIRNDGSAVAWGYSSANLGNGFVGADFSTIQSC